MSSTYSHPIPQAFAIGVWENEGGSLGRDSMDSQYGRRVEGDRSWTVYHVFSGTPAGFSGQAMTGLSRFAATNAMISLNLRNLRRRSERATLFAPGRRTRENRELPS